MLEGLDDVRKCLQGSQHGGLYVSRGEVEAVVGRILHQTDLTREVVRLTEAEVEDHLRKARYDRKLSEMGRSLLALDLRRILDDHAVNIAGHEDAYHAADRTRLEWITSFLRERVAPAFNDSASPENIKKVTDVGNSAGVIIPAKFRGQTAHLIDLENRLVIIVDYNHQKIAV